MSEPNTKHAAVSYIERSDGRVLCVWNRRYGGFSLPGGLVEEGETPEQAQARELREETGMETLAVRPMFEGPAVRPRALLADDQPEIDRRRAGHTHLFAVVAEGVPRECEQGAPGPTRV